MSDRPDFTAMTSRQLRAYVLEHRQDEEALHAFIDKRHAENPNPRLYNPGDDFDAAFREHLKYLAEKQQEEEQ